MAITASPGKRYADLAFDGRHNRLLCVREDHSGPGEAVNTIVAVELSGQGGERVLAGGNDFYASPRISPDGRLLAWQTWHHPHMPWDGCELWLTEYGPEGVEGQPRLIAGGPQESIFQPDWSPGGELFFVSDRTGWWNLYCLQADGIVALCPQEAEFGRPQWVFGASSYTFLGEDRLICLYDRAGFTSLATLDLKERLLEPLDLPYTHVRTIRANERAVVFIGASATSLPGVVLMDVNLRHPQVLRRTSDVPVDEGYLSSAEAIEFPTEEGLTAHALFYPPVNQEFQGPEGEKPPLIVMSHGGPTSMTIPSLSWQIQYWTSRGLAVLDVNYGGSSGFGRAYRQRLNGRWGIVDVLDCVNGAQYLVDRGLVDGDRLAIRGGSAGGYTTLRAMTWTKAFKAGASYFGVSDLELLAKETHKFESRYLDSLVGLYPEQADRYRERSPINHVEDLACAVILFQGLEDRVVPPSQAERLVEAATKKGLTVAYLSFEGEQHGFRKADTIKRCLDAELYFYGRLLGFEVAESVEPVAIENL